MTAFIGTLIWGVVNRGIVCFMTTRSLGTASKEVCEVGGTQGGSGVSGCWDREGLGAEGTSEPHLGKQGEKVRIREGALQEEVLVNKARQN